MLCQHELNVTVMLPLCYGNVTRLLLVDG